MASSGEQVLPSARYRRHVENCFRPQLGNTTPPNGSAGDPSPDHGRVDQQMRRFPVGATSAVLTSIAPILAAGHPMVRRCDQPRQSASNLNYAPTPPSPTPPSPTSPPTAQPASTAKPLPTSSWTPTATTDGAPSQSHEHPVCNLVLEGPPRRGRRRHRSRVRRSSTPRRALGIAARRPERLVATNREAFSGSRSARSAGVRLGASGQAARRLHPRTGRRGALPAHRPRSERPPSV